MFDPQAETYEQFLARWEAEANEHAPNPFEVAEWKDGQPYPPPDERRTLPRMMPLDDNQ